jgi:protein arginine kinase
MDINNLIMTTRIRLARNCDGIPFKLKDRSVFEAIAKSIVADNPHYFMLPASELPETMRNALFEQHLISKDFLANYEYGMLVTDKENKVSIMLGEEDHIRIQAITNEYDINNTYQTAKRIADRLETKFKIAKSKQLGYLTRCPTNLGSGMRVSVMIYLPALTLTGEIRKIFTSIKNTKITIRGVYGEGSNTSGCIYQISNQNSIFANDNDILNLLHTTVQKIAIAEMKLQQQIYKEDRDEINDKVMRAVGILTNAILISSAEATEHLVWIKLGLSLGILSSKNNRIIDDLFFITKPSTLLTQIQATKNLSRSADSSLSPRERDKIRASKIREVLRSAIIIV